MNSSGADLPQACIPNALAPEAWAEHQTTITRLFTELCEAVSEQADGYAFQFAADDLPLVAAFVNGERRCCPFLTFQIEVPPGETAITLQISSAPEAKPIIAAQFLLSAPGIAENHS